MKISFHMVEPTAFFVMRTNEDTLEAHLAGVLHRHENGEWRYAQHDPHAVNPFVESFADMDLLCVIRQIHVQLGGEL